MTRLYRGLRVAIAPVTVAVAPLLLLRLLMWPPPEAIYEFDLPWKGIGLVVVITVLGLVGLILLIILLSPMDDDDTTTVAPPDFIEPPEDEGGAPHEPATTFPAHEATAPSLFTTLAGVFVVTWTAPLVALVWLANPGQPTRGLRIAVACGCIVAGWWYYRRIRTTLDRPGDRIAYWTAVVTVPVVVLNIVFP